MHLLQVNHLRHADKTCTRQFVQIWGIPKSRQSGSFLVSNHPIFLVKNHPIFGVNDAESLPKCCFPSQGIQYKYAPTSGVYPDRRARDFRRCCRNPPYHITPQPVCSIPLSRTTPATIERNQSLSWAKAAYSKAWNTGLIDLHSIPDLLQTRKSNPQTLWHQITTG